MKNHPIADVWPQMTETELNQLTDDIRVHGLLSPIVTYEGMILDGRNRAMACERAQVSPRFAPYTGDNPVAFAFSCNEARRHLTSGQRAALAVELKPQLEEEARKRQSAAGGDRKSATARETLVQKVAQAIPPAPKARQQAAAIAGSNHAYVDQAERIKQKAPEVFDRLKDGKISMQDARREAAKIPVDDWTDDERRRQKELQAGASILANAGADKNLITWAEAKGLAVYIGRGSLYGNPFVLDRDGTRDQVCDHYEQHYLPFKPSILKSLPGLRGKVLVCHCHPQRCHGLALLAKLKEDRQ
jgi:hypothetical protein